MKYLTLEEAGYFHGHLGPYLTLGYLAGKIAVSQLKPSNEHELKATVRCPLKTPYTCFIDGIQCSSKCTLGKGNIHVEKGVGLTVVFECRGRKLTLKVKNKILGELKDISSLEDGVRWVLEREQEIFDTLWT